MAPFNQIQIGRLNRWIQKLLSIKGRSSLETISPELCAMLPMERGVDDFYLQSILKFQTGAQASPVAQFYSFQLRNPSGSNVIATIEQVFIAVGVAVLFQVSYGPATGGVGGGIESGPARGMDQRDPRQAVCLFSNALSAALQTLANGKGLFGVPNSNESIPYIHHLKQEIPLGPGDAYLFSTNVSITGNAGSYVQWRERFLEDSERT